MENTQIKDTNEISMIQGFYKRDMFAKAASFLPEAILYNPHAFGDSIIEVINFNSKQPSSFLNPKIIGEA